MAWPQKEKILIFVTFNRNPIGDRIGSDFDSIQVTQSGQPATKTKICLKRNADFFDLKDKLLIGETHIFSIHTYSVAFILIYAWT